MTLRGESVHSLPEGKAVVQFGIKGSQAGTIRIVLAQYFGVGGSPDASVVLEEDIEVTTTETVITRVVDVPTTEGKTLGTSRDTILLNFITSQGATYPAGAGSNPLPAYTGSIEITDVQTEAGVTPTEYDRIPFAELQRIMWRYHQIHTIAASPIFYRAGERIWVQRVICY